MKGVLNHPDIIMGKVERNEKTATKEKRYLLLLLYKINKEAIDNLLYHLRKENAFERRGVKIEYKRTNYSVYHSFGTSINLDAEFEISIGSLKKNINITIAGE
jgi:hypothetical protein